jgi:hypothetical protein
MPQTDKLVTLLEKLITDADRLVKDSIHGAHRSRHIQDREGLRRWSNDLILFRSLAGGMIEPWGTRLTHDGRVILADDVEYPLSALKTIRDAIAQGLLTRYEDLIVADTFADITEQAGHLLSQGYFLAAGVILRAVLEERLRKLCSRHNIVLTKTRPTISDFNIALYNSTPPVFDKSMMFHVTALAAVGNDAAHNVPGLKREDVDRLALGIKDFLARFST